MYCTIFLLENQIYKILLLIYFSFRYKFKKWWSQSHLVGIPRIVAGFRDNNGIVNSVKTYNVEEMPHLAKVQYVSFNAEEGQIM